MPDTWWVIMEDEPNTDEPLYWSNKFGWCGLDDADYFTSSERSMLDAPIGGVWERSLD